MRRNKYWFFGVLLSASTLFWSCGTAPSPEPSAPEIEEVVEEIPDTTRSPQQLHKAAQLERYFAQLHREKAFNGTVLMAEEGKVVYHDAFGLANKKAKDTLTVEHAFQLASVSKPITAYGILLLKDQGKLNLDDNVRKYLPNFPYEGITIRMCLTHRSGMCNYMYFSDEVWPDRYVNPISNNDVLRLMAEHLPNPYYQPNQQYDYSNSGYMVLASIVEKISGKDFEDFMRSEVFEPLKMNATTIYRKGKPFEHEPVAIGYDGRGRKAEDTYLNGVVGDKGVYSTTADLLKLDQAMYEGSLVSLETLEEAFTPANEERKNKDNYGLGWRIKTVETDQRKVIYHTGWWKGFRTYFIRDIQHQKTLIVLDNYKRGRFLKVNELLEIMN